ncbi:hypothetical protein Tco_1576967 [Tanacetum coccineum]
MLRRHHKVDDQHHDMPLIYYMEGHKLHFGRREFSLITGFCFGTVSFDLHSSGELKFQNRVFPNKIGFSITNLDIIGVIEDEAIFGKLSDDDVIRLCLLLALEESRAPPIKEHHGFFETYLSKLEKARKRGKTVFMVSLIGGTTDNSVRKKWLNDLVIMELNFRLFKLETIIHVLSHERSDRQAKLKFTDEFPSMTSDLCDSLNSMFADLIEPVDLDKDIAQDYLREEELRLCLEGEEKMRCEHQKLIVEENRIRLDETKRLRQSGQIKCKFPWNNDYIVDMNFWRKLVYLDPTRKGWLTKEVQLPVVLECANIFQKNRIDPSKYTITLAHGLSLDVDDPVDVALAIDDSTENYSLFDVNYDGMFDERPLRHAQTECKIRALFYSIPRNSLETGLTIVEFYNDVKKMYDTAELYGLINLYISHFPRNLASYYFKNLTFDEAHGDIQSKVTSHEKLKSHGKLALMTFDESRSWEKEQSISPLLRTPPLKKRRKGIAFQGKNFYEDVYGGGCFDVSGSFKGFDCIEEPVGCDDGSLPVKIKDEFENEVILDDVVSSPATLSMLLKRKGKSRVKFTRMRGIIKRSKMVSLRMRVRSNY